MKLAQTLKEKEAAFRLVHDRYSEVGLLSPQPNRLWPTLFHALPASKVAISVLVGKKEMPISTGTLVQDSLLGLPSDRIYRAEIDQFRCRGRQVAEVSCLAAIPTPKARNSFMYLFRHIALYALHKKVDDLVISVHPKHTRFYENILLFSPIGPLRYYPKLKDAPAILEHLDLRNAPQFFQDAYRILPSEQNLADFFFGVHNQDLYDLDRMFSGADSENSMSQEDFYSLFVEKTDVWANATDEEKKYILSIHEGLEDYLRKSMS
jgi:hypothetical protein